MNKIFSINIIILSFIPLLLSSNANALEYQVTEYNWTPSQIDVPDELYDDVSGLGGFETIVYGHNNSGQFVGTTSHSAFIWDSVYGARFLPDMSHAVDINESGQVVGYSAVPWKTFVNAFIWDNTNGSQDLGSLGYKFTYAQGINDFGWVVGISAILDASSTNHAFIWNSQDGMKDLNNYLPDNSGWVLHNALSISNNGEIIGEGKLNDSNRHFIMTPVANSPPSIPILIYPSDDQINLGTSVSFMWGKSTDVDGDSISYNVQLCTDINFTVECITRQYNASSQKNEIYYAGPSFSLLMIGAIFAGSIIGNLKKWLMGIIVLGSVAVVLSCGNGSSGNSDQLSQTISGLNSNTTYYWRVIATDNNGGIVNSDVRSFTTD